MNRFKVIALFVALGSVLESASRDSKITFELLKKGASLSIDDAEKLEEQVAKNPHDDEARIQLLSFYAGRPAGLELSAVKAARAKHILWLVENDPGEGLGLYRLPTGVYRMNCRGDDLADPEGFERISQLWLRQVKKNPASKEIRSAAVAAIEYCLPEQAEQLLTEFNDNSGLGNLYAVAVLGITGKSYQDIDPTGSDPALRESAFAQKTRRILEEATDKDLLTSAASTLLRQGATLWADGKLDWDYTPLGNNLLSKAKSKGAEGMMLLTLPLALPARGERPPMTIRVGGNVQAAQLLRKVAPTYPPAARHQHIQGTVKITALIGLDGRILYLRPDSGPSELIPASIEAVRQWQYKSTLLNGKPCYVLTVIDVNYTLTQ